MFEFSQSRFSPSVPRDFVVFFASDGVRFNGSSLYARCGATMRRLKIPAASVAAPSLLTASEAFKTPMNDNSFRTTTE